MSEPESARPDSDINTDTAADTDGRGRGRLHGVAVDPAFPGDAIPPALDAATIMLLRDDPDLHVLMLRRNAQSTFVGGAMLFPGGAVDPDDAHPSFADLGHGLDDDHASTITGVPAQGLRYWIAAVRECFEEAGLLHAREPDGEPLRRDLGVHRGTVDRGERTFSSFVADEGLRLDLEPIHYFGHWITPRGRHRRYDTRFFVAAAPEHQEPSHDDRETVAWEWVRPADMLERSRDRQAWMLPPTVACLEALSAFDRSASFLEVAASANARPARAPGLVEHLGGVRIRLPDDSAAPATEIDDHSLFLRSLATG